MPSAVASSCPVAPSMLTCGSVTPSRPPPNSGFCRPARPCAGRRGSRRGPRRRSPARPSRSPNLTRLTDLRGRPASSSGRRELEVELLLDVGDAGRRASACRAASTPVGGLSSVTFAPAGGVASNLRRRDRAVGDVGRLELEHRVLRALGVDRGAQRHAAGGVPGELGRAEQPAVVLGRDPHGVARAVARSCWASRRTAATSRRAWRGLHGRRRASRALLSARAGFSSWGSAPVKAVFEVAS